MNTGKFLTPAQYWNWRFLMSEMSKATAERETSRLKYAIIQKDIEIAQMKAERFKATDCVAKDAAVKDTFEAYTAFRKEVEDNIGMELKNCSIDDVTFEVLTLEE